MPARDSIFGLIGRSYNAGMKPSLRLIYLTTRIIRKSRGMPVNSDTALIVGILEINLSGAPVSGIRVSKGLENIDRIVGTDATRRFEKR